MRSFSFRRENQTITICSHLPGLTPANVVISDLGIDCSYYNLETSLSCLEESGYSLWLNPMHPVLWERVKENPLFPGFRCKIFNSSGKLLACQDFPMGDQQNIPKTLYSTDPFDGCGPSYADFFYTDLLDGMDFSGVVIDAGANSGFFTLKALKEGAHRVYLIEPDVSPFYYSQINYFNNPRVVLINKALSVDTNPLEFQISNSGSVGNSAVYEVQNSRKITVPSIDLHTMLSIESRISLLKLDIEGMEYDVMRRLDDSHFEKVDQWFIEFHRGPQDIEEILKSKGYKTEYRNLDSGTVTGYIWARRSIDAV